MGGCLRGAEAGWLADVRSAGGVAGVWRAVSRDDVRKWGSAELAGGRAAVRQRA